VDVAMRVLFLTKYPDRGPSSRYRVLQFLPFLEANGIRATVHALHDDRYLEARYASRSVSPFYLSRRCASRLAAVAAAPRHDLVFIQKEMLPHLIDAPEWWMARTGVRYAVDLDDAIHLMYANAGGWRRALRAKIPRVLSRASLVLAGNRWLEAYARGYSDRVVYFPTVVDTSRFIPAAGAGGGATPVVGWMGTPETVRYLAAVTPALAAAAQRTPLSLLVVGAEPPASALATRAKPWSYAEEAADLRAMDIGIMPLADDEWSKGKCALKLLQYMSAGLPSVTSPRGSAVEFVHDGDNACFASTPDEWRDRVAGLASSPERRLRMGASARATVESRYSLRAWEPRFADALRWGAGVGAERPRWSEEGARGHA
jgi:glycosyltransferase involved in cell wall biosynthesis